MFIVGRQQVAYCTNMVVNCIHIIYKKYKDLKEGSTIRKHRYIDGVGET